MVAAATPQVTQTPELTDLQAAARWVHWSTLRRWVKNPRKNAKAVPKVAASIREFGFIAPVVVWPSQDRIVAGDTRVQAMARLMGDDVAFTPKGAPGPGMVRAVFHEFADEREAELYAIADNRLNEVAEWDDEGVADILGRYSDEDRVLVGFDEDVVARNDEDDAPADTSGSLATRFGVPPFSVLDARQGYWKERKEAWLALGIRSEVGRGEALLGGLPNLGSDPMKVMAKGAPRPGGGGNRDVREGQPFGEEYKGGDAWRSGAGRLTFVQGTRDASELDEVSRKILESGSGTSIFDPVLTELCIRWFCPPDGTVLDPFAGGSVRGIVSAATGRPYVGVDLRPEQVAANRVQWDAIGPKLTAAKGATARWVAGDSRTVLRTKDVPDAVDFVFTCPPYADLEVYSDDPLDISGMPYGEFLVAYRDIIDRAVARLRKDRFAAIVVGDVRAPDGSYRNFVSDTIKAFLDAGMTLYNEAILVTAIGSLAIRAGRQFQLGRKLGKTHQNVLVFVKGDAKAAVAAIGDVDFGEAAEAFGEVLE